MLRANHQLVKFTQDGCQSLFYIICDNPTKVDATGHHHNVISKALSFQSLAPATYNSCACHAVFYFPTSRVWFVWACQCNAHATHMQHTCNTHATHMQHEHFPCKFPSKVAAGAKIYTFHSKTGVGAANVKSCTLTVNLQVKSSCCMSCCMCVACVLHVCCMCVAWQVCRIEQSRSQSGAPATQNDSQCTQRHCGIRSKRCQDKTVAACISLSTTHISTYAPAQANRHTHTQTPAQTDPDAFSDTVSSSFSRLSAAMGPSYCVFSESGEVFLGSEFILTVVDMHVDVDQHTYTHRCDNISFWNLRIVKACASVICDSPIKVDAKG